jgi:hypothetical protein
MITVNGNKLFLIADYGEFIDIVDKLTDDGYVWLDGYEPRIKEYPIILKADYNKTLMHSIVSIYKERYMRDPHYKKLFRQKKLERILNK